MLYYTIGEMADILGVAASTLRYYDKEGLLPFVERTAGGIRRFKESDLEWLVTIEHLKKTGMPIRDIRVFIDWCMAGDTTLACRLELIDRQREAVRAQIAQLEDTMKILDYKHWYYQTALDAGTCAVHTQEEGAPQPPDRLLEGQALACCHSACAALEHARAAAARCRSQCRRAACDADSDN